MFARTSANLKLVDACDAGRFSLYVSEDMQVHPCSFQNGIAPGDILNDTTSLRDIWLHSENMKSFRRYFGSNRCSGCSHQSSCMNGCPLFDDLVACGNRPSLNARLLRLPFRNANQSGKDCLPPSAPRRAGRSSDVRGTRMFYGRAVDRPGRRHWGDTGTSLGDSRSEINDASSWPSAFIEFSINSLVEKARISRTRTWTITWFAH
ncbi:SPASM domain-containing protein [Endobacterium cereale]|uniref:SPASM domain-containing protein n=1 Tax=Endobacterium cereale TaxID=2663029 RepID=UPI00397AE62A